MMKRILIFVCALFMFGACHAATLNIRHNGITKQIELDTIKRTAPALAMRVGNKTMYATMARTTTQKSGGLYVKYNNQTYHILETFPESKFQITTTEMSASTTFSFTMSAVGTFYVDWGDGAVDEIVRTNTNNTTYFHTYTTAGAHRIVFDGLATGYNTNTVAAISFNGNTNVAAIDGSLGAIFPTLGATNGNQPRFCRTFRDCTELTTVSQNLFNGVSGAIDNMFEQTFAFCVGLEEIPPGLFNGIEGAGKGMFNSLFFGCSKLKEIPDGLFNGASDAAVSMFGGTFKNCVGLEKLPSSLFNGTFGSAEWMFHSMFSNCSNLDGTIPQGFFGNISGAPAANMFRETFADCAKLSGSTVLMTNKTELYDIENPETGKTWWNENKDTFYDMYRNTKIDGVRY